MILRLPVRKEGLFRGHLRDQLYPVVSGTVCLHGRVWYETKSSKSLLGNVIVFKGKEAQHVQRDTVLATWVSVLRSRQGVPWQE
jgi:hypothetical protein